MLSFLTLQCTVIEYACTVIKHWTLVINLSPLVVAQEHSHQPLTAVCGTGACEIRERRRQLGEQSIGYVALLISGFDAWPVQRSMSTGRITHRPSPSSGLIRWLLNNSTLVKYNDGTAALITAVCVCVFSTT